MKINIFYLLKKYIFIKVAFLLITPVFSILSFSYPTATTLNNGNIFIIHKDGVDSTDPTCTTINNYPKKTFYDDSEKINTEEKLSKVSISKFSDGYICTIYNDKINIFGRSAEFKRSSYTIDSSLSSYISYYCLRAYKVY